MKAANTKILPIRLILILISVCIASAKPQARLAFAQYCLYHGYPTQTHIIRTHDGYNLKFFRLQGRCARIQPKIVQLDQNRRFYTCNMDCKIHQILGLLMTQILHLGSYLLIGAMMYGLAILEVMPIATHSSIQKLKTFGILVSIKWLNMIYLPPFNTYTIKHKRKYITLATAKEL